MSTSATITGNKGEWSELYALLKLLADGQLQPGNADLQASKEAPLKVLSLARSDSTGRVQYTLLGGEISVQTANTTLTLQAADCALWAQNLLTAIKTESTESGAKAIPEATGWMQALATTSLKACSTDKADIEIVLHDVHTGAAPQLGFSVKSYLGGAPTLLNASAHTNFVYALRNCSALNQSTFNQALDATGFTAAFATLPAHLQPDAGQSTVDSTVFGQNLALLDCQLQTIIGHLMLLSYQGQHGTQLDALCQVLEQLNPLKVASEQLNFFYKYKIKRFLVCVALGLTPATLWTGQYHANGGYVIVKRTGDLVSYHVYAINQFEDYLFFNTQFEKPSKTRHGYGRIYQSGADYFLKLNLQIRFIKR
jgi:HpaII restriction endonuclease